MTLCAYLRVYLLLLAASAAPAPAPAAAGGGGGGAAAAAGAGAGAEGGGCGGRGGGGGGGGGVTDSRPEVWHEWVDIVPYFQDDIVPYFQGTPRNTTDIPDSATAGRLEDASHLTTPATAVMSMDMVLYKVLFPL